NGVPRGVRRRGALDVAAGGGAETVPLDYTFPLDADGDPLAGLFDRLGNDLLARFRHQLAAGGPVSGDGWWLDHYGLTVEEDGDQRHYPHGTLVAVSEVDRRVKAWERG